MNNDSLVSVITIFLNEEAFIAEAIDSVVNQSYENWELLLVDDGSTDTSSQIAKKYAEKFPGKIIYLEHEGHSNLGMSASRNLALSKAKGEFISFIDADDYWLPQKLKYQVHNIQEHPEAAMVVSPAQLWYSWTGKLEDRLRDLNQEFPIATGQLCEAPGLLNLFLTNEFFSICDVLVRKSIVDAVGGYESEFKGMYEDQVFHSKICLKYPVYISKETWYRYRRHPGSCTHESLRSDDHLIKRAKFLEWLKEFLENSEDTTPEVQACFNDAYWPTQHRFIARIFSGKPDKGNIKRLIDRMGKAILPEKLHRWLFNQFLYKNWPPVGFIRFGSFRRLKPFSPVWTTRGSPIDRYYIEAYMRKHAADIQGHVLEIADDNYTWQFGENKVSKSDVLHYVEGNPKATLVGDLCQSDFIPSNQFDCIIFTQTLFLIYDFKKVITSLFRILKPGGVLLVTVPSITHVVSGKDKDWQDQWRFTIRSMETLFSEVFPKEHIETGAYGNVLSATGFLYGMGCEELKPKELDYYDPEYPMIVTLRAVKPEEK